jgi:hypothetical protein
VKFITFQLQSASIAGDQGIHCIDAQGKLIETDKGYQYFDVD